MFLARFSRSCQISLLTFQDLLVLMVVESLPASVACVIFKCRNLLAKLLNAFVLAVLIKLRAGDLSSQVVKILALLIPYSVRLVGLDLGFNVNLLELFERGFKFFNLFFMSGSP
jgi:hypothetical protein